METRQHLIGTALHGGARWAVRWIWLLALVSAPACGMIGVPTGPAMPETQSGITTTVQSPAGAQVAEQAGSLAALSISSSPTLGSAKSVGMQYVGLNSWIPAEPNSGVTESSVTSSSMLDSAKSVRMQYVGLNSWIPADPSGAP